MSGLGLWIRKVTMTNVDLPEMTVRGDFVLSSLSDGLELSRCTGAVKAFSSDDVDKRIVSIGTGAFANVEALRSVVLSGSVTRIDDYAYMGCEDLADVRLQDGLASIGSNAFAGCKNLRGLYVPPTVTLIGANAFPDDGDFTLYGAKDSAIHRYAVANGMTFISARGPAAAA